MLVNITQDFFVENRRWKVGDNPDVPKEVALRWIAEGKATADTDGRRNDGSAVQEDGNLTALRYPTGDILAADAPTITLTGSTAPGGVTTYGHASPELDFLGPGPWSLRADTAFLRPFIAASYCTMGWRTDSPDFYLRHENNNNRMTLHYDLLDGQGWRYGGAVSLPATGTREHVRVQFATRQMRRFSLRGFNMTFGGVMAAAGDTVLRDTSPLLPLLHVTGDSYTQGTGALGGALTWAGHAAAVLGRELSSDGIGSTGWLTATPTTPAERITARGPANIVRRNAGVETPAVVDRFVYALGYNDSAGNQSAIAASIDAALQAYSSPRAILLGPWTPLGDTANLTATAATIEARAAANGAQFVSVQGIVTAANRVNLTDADNVHPSIYGHKHLGWEIAQRLRAAALA